MLPRSFNLTRLLFALSLPFLDPSLVFPIGFLHGYCCICRVNSLSKISMFCPEAGQKRVVSQDVV